MPRLPSEAAALLAGRRGRRLVRVRRQAPVPDDATVARDAGVGPVELAFDDGVVVCFWPELRRRSVLVAAGELQGELVDVSRAAFWRYRLRREVIDVQVLKSLDVPPSAPELEWGIELVLRATRPVVLELDEVDGEEVLLVGDGSRVERCRRLSL